MVSVNGLFPVGGLVANATDVTLTSCYSTGAVGGTLFVGGLIATASGSSTLTSCYATGDVVGSGDRVGGLIATAVSNVTITSCYATGNVTGSGNTVGGLAGSVASASTLTSCYAIGDVEGASQVGGLVGDSDGSISLSYATGNVEGSDDVGGLVGTTSSPVTSSYATGAVDGRSNVGGLVGNLGPSGAITASYYDNSSASRGIGSLGADHTRQAAVSKTTSELQMPTAYDDNMDDTDGSSIYEAWNIGGEEPWDFLGDNRYPRLRVDFNNDGDTTVAEFGPQLLLFVDGGGVELRSVAFEIAEGAAGTIGTLPSAINDENDNEAMVSLVGMSDEFEVSGSDLNVKATTMFDYQTEHRYRLVFELEEGDLTTKRSVFIEITNPNAAYVDGLIDITTLAQLNVVRFDLNGDGMIDAGVSMEDSVAYETAFGLMRGDVACASGCVGYELMNDLDFRLGATLTDDYSIWAEGSTATGAVSAGWVPIATSSDPYTGVFEGNSHTISNLFINRESSSRMGFFGDVHGGTIRNLGLEEGSVTGGLDYTGALAGEVDDGTTISSCYATVGVEGNTSVGGLVGASVESEITSCYAAGSVVGASDGGAGGLVGNAVSGSITSCYATGDVESSDGDVGGLVGDVSGLEITSCYATGAVDGSTNVGGLVGLAYNGSSISASYSTGSVSSPNDDVGGLVGDVSGIEITSCYATGSVSGTDNVGGFAGRMDNESSITASYSLGSVSGTDNVGGFAGQLDNESSITASYSLGNVDGSTNVGGLVGELTNNSVVTASYYDDLSSVKGVGSLGGGHVLQIATSRSSSALQSPTDYSDIYEDWNAEGDDLWDFLRADRYPRLKVDFNDDGTATFAEFGPQILVFVGGGSEVGPVLRIDETTGAGTTIATLSGTNAVNSNVAMVSLVEMSDEFELSGSDLNVKAGVMFDYQTERRYELVFELEEGGLTTRRSVVVEIINPNDEDGDGLIDIPTLDQLNMVRFDLNGDGMIDAGVSMEDTESYEMAFGLESGEVACASGCEGYELMNDLDFRLGATQTADYSVWAEGSTAAEAVPAGWLPIGTNSNPYTGVFEGNGHTVSNLFINRPSSSFIGFFGNVDRATLRNLGLEEGIVTGGMDYTAALVGLTAGTTISSCYATVGVEGENSVGGLVAGLGSSSMITLCYATGNVVGSGFHVGGLVGSVNGSTMSSCYATGNVEASSQVGGLVGVVDGSVTLSYATGDVTGSNDEVGGLVGEAFGSISSCYATGAVEGNDEVGGLVGDVGTSSMVISCYAMGAVEGNDEVGGLVGNLESDGEITASYYDNLSSFEGRRELGGWC